MNRYDESLQEYDKAIEIDPKYVRAYYSRGNVWHEKGEYERAIADYRAAIQLDSLLAEANFGLAVYPTTIEIQDTSGMKKTLDTGVEPWSWQSFCKTEYASDPACGGIENFLRCHLSVIHLLDHARNLGILKAIDDEGTYWENRDVRSLAEEVVRWNEQMAGMAGKMKDLLGGDVEAAIMKFQNFEHLEAKGRKDE